MQYRYVAFRVLRVVCLVAPGVYPVSLRVPLQAKDFDHAIPYRFALEGFGNRNALQMLRLRAVQVMDHVPKLLNVRHAHASTRSPTDQKDGSTPAAIAGVQRSVL